MTPTERKEQALYEARILVGHAMGVCVSDAGNIPLQQEELFKALKAIYAACAACVDEALAPRDPSPELAEAERNLLDLGGNITGDEAQSIAAELTRLRATVARLEAENIALHRDLLKLVAAATHGNSHAVDATPVAIVTARLKELEAIAMGAVKLC